jgi:heme-degrading monooxygenase HmoA
MIFRIWRGWASLADAEAYERLVDEEIVPGIIARDLPGLRRIEILRRPHEDAGEVEFVTIMVFDDQPAVDAFTGGTTAYVPAAARRLLRRFDEDSQHYELVGTHPRRRG